MKKTNLIISISLLAACFLVNDVAIARGKLPFIGTKSFNFSGGTGTGESITINKNGSAIIKHYGTSGSSVLYKGKFSNHIKSKDGEEWLLKGDKIYSLTNGKIDKDCMGDGKPCVSDLYGDDPTPPVASDAGKLKKMTVTGKILYGTLDSGIEDINGGPGLTFLSDSKMAAKIFKKCQQDDICKISGLVKVSYDDGGGVLSKLVSVKLIKDNTPAY
ncbi:hypothetical protein [Crenothrix sp.]|uniref:hypothetical protein n=1 Tax=Crenothrix sp. TaxID=3100433 RepID=UPI00374D4B3F